MMISTKFPYQKSVNRFWDKRWPGQDILIVGSATLVQSLRQTDLIDEYLFTVFPIIAGTGKRFFKEGMGLTQLKLVENKILSLGVVVLCYKVTVEREK